MEYKFVFQAVPEQEKLFRQVSQGLEKLTEMYSREKLPGLWKVTDRLNRAQEGKAPISSGRRNFRRVMALVDWLLGIFALIPAVQSPKELGTLLAVGAAAFGVGAGMLWVLLPRTLGVLSLLISLPLIMGSLGNPDQLENLLGLGVLLLLLGLAVLFSKFRRKENPYERAARDLLSHARDFQRDTQAEALLFLPEGIGYTVPEGVELSEPGLLDYSKLEAMVETADLWLMVAEQKGMILQKQEFQGDPDSFHAFLQEKGVRIIPA